MADVTTLQGYLKRITGELEKPIPEFAELQKRIPFGTSERLGKNYIFPVILRRPHGTTFAGGATSGTAFALNAAVAGLSLEATLTGTEFVIRENIAYQLSSRGQGGQRSFNPDAVDLTLEEMTESARFYLEMCMLYGGTSIGTVSANDDATDRLTISLATWAPGLWAQMEGAKIDVYDPTLTTKRNADAITVSSIDPDNRYVFMTGTEAQMDAIQVNDVIVPYGANGNWFDGIDKIITNTGSLFGISATTYNMWRANTSAVGSTALTMAKLQNAVTKAVVRGMMGSSIALVSNYTWTDFNSDLAALRRFANDTRNEISVGTQSIKFFGAGGELEIVPHAMQKAGEAFVFQPKNVKRRGSTDLTFQLPGTVDHFHTELADNAGFQVRGYWDQGIIIPKPARCVKLTGIVNNSLSS